MSGAKRFGVLISFVLLVIVLSSVSAANIGALSHSADVTLSPDVSGCDVGTEFTVNVKNTGGYGIYDVKIAKTFYF